MTRQQTIGRWGENVAAEYLTNRGVEVIARNARTPYGELDLIARIKDMLIIVEVKTRTGGGFGLPEEAVNAKKREHLINSALHYMQVNDLMEMTWRIDVIAIQGRPGQPGTQIEWFENAVS